MARRDVVLGGVRLVAGLVGLGIGYLLWDTLWERFIADVPAHALAVVRESAYFGTIGALAAVLVILGSGLVLAGVAGWGVAFVMTDEVRSVSGDRSE
jgi:hypothetical protein